MQRSSVNTAYWVWAALFLCLATAGPLSSAGAATFTWTGAASTDWFNTNNWSPAGLPASSDTVNFSSGTINLSAPVTISGVFNWSGGTLTGNPLTIATNGLLKSSGGSGYTLGVVLTNAGTVQLTGSGNLFLDGTTGGGQIYNLAGGLIDLLGFVYIRNNARGGEVVVNQGTFRDSWAANQLLVYAPVLNSGTLTTVQGTLVLNGSGTLGGTITVAGGTTLNLGAGNFTNSAALGSTGPGTFQLTGGSLTLLNDTITNLQMQAGTVNLGPVFQGGTITNLTLTGASLSGSNTVSGTFNWSGIVLSNLVVAAGATVTWTNGYAQGPVTVQSNGVLNLTGNNTKYIWNGLTNAGTVTWSGSGNLDVDYSSANSEYGLIQNLAGALFDIQNNQSLTTVYNTASFQNAGTLRKSIGTGITTIAIPFVNTGTLTLLQGTITFSGGGTLGGAMSAAAGTTLTFSAGSFGYTSPPTLTGPGTIQLTGGSLTLLNNIITNLQLAGGTVSLGPAFQGGTITNLTLMAGTLTGTNTVSGVFNWAATLPGGLTLLAGATGNWSNGSIAGPLLVASNAVLNISGNNTKFVWNSFTNAGTVTWSGGGNLQVDNSSAQNLYGFIQNLSGALFDIQNNQNLLNGYNNGAYFQNAGTVRKSVGTGTSTITIPFLNSGLVTVQAGTLTFNNGGLISGTFIAAAGASISFNTGSFSYTSPPTLNGPGAIQLSGGTLTLANDIIPNLQLAGGTVTLGSGFQGGVITNLTLTSGILSGSAFTVAGAFNWSGTLTGSVAVLSGGVVTWSGGYAQGPINVASNGVFNITGNPTKYLWNALTNAGTVTWTGGGNLQVDYSSANNDYGLIQNLSGGLFDIQNNQSLQSGYNNGAYLQNAGTLRKSIGTSTATIAIPFLNSGSVTVLAGVLTFNNGATIGGSFSAGAGTTINFNAGSFGYSTPPSMSGPGTIQLTGGTLTLVNDIIANLQLAGGTVSLGPNFQGSTITNLTLLSGTLTGNNSVSGTFNWAGTLPGGLSLLPGAVVNWSAGSVAGPVTIASNAVMNLSGSASKFIWNGFTNAGTVTWSGTGNLQVDYSTANTQFGLIQNLPGALWDIQNNQIVLSAFNNGTYFQNAGTLHKSAGGGTTTFFIPLLNSGLVTVLSGLLTFNNGSILNGTFNTATGSTINFNAGNYSYTSAPVITGTGIVQISGGSLTLLNNTIPNLQLAGGTISLGPNFQGGTITNLTLLGGTLNGSNYVVSGLFNWSGTLPGSLTVVSGGVVNWSGGTAFGPITVASNGVLNLIGSNTKYVENALTNGGTVTWSGSGSLEVDYSTANNSYGFIQNLAGALWDIQGDQTLLNGYPNGAYFQNAGTLRKSAGVGTSAFAMPFFNSGIVSVLAQTLSFNNGGVIGGTFSAATGTALRFNSGGFSYTVPPVVNGAGAVQLTGGSLTLINDIIPNLQLAGGTVSLGAGFQGGTITNLTLLAGTLTGNNTVSGTFNWSGNLPGSLTLANGAVVNWTGGTAFGQVNIASNATLNLGGGNTKNLFNALTNAGTVTWSGGGNLDVAYSTAANEFGLIQNLPNGLWDIQNNQNMYNDFANSAYFQNSGTVRKSAGTGTSMFSIPFFNTGTTLALQGTLAFNGGFTLTGGTLVAGLNPTSPGQFSASGNAALDGTLNVVWSGGYVPAISNAFTLFSYGSHSSVFPVLNLPAAANWQVNYGAAALTIGVADVSRLVLATPSPVSTNAGAILTPITVQVQDSATGNSIATNGLPVSVSLSSGIGTLSGTLTRLTDVNGRATFNDLSINLVGPKTLTLSAPGLTPTNTTSFNIVPAAPAQLALLNSIGATQRDETVFVPPPLVQVQDQFGNGVSNSTATITARLSSGGGGLLGGTTSLNADGLTGSALFTNLVYALANHQAGESIVVYFTSPGLASVTNPPAWVNFVFGLITLQSGNSIMQINPGSQAGINSWSVDGTNQLFQQWWWLRRGSNSSQVSLDTLGPPIGVSVSPTNAVVNYQGAGLNVNLGFLLKGGAAGSLASDLTETFSIQNTSNGPVSLHLFQYADFDLANASLGDTVSFPTANSVMQQGKGMNITETVQAPTPNYFEASYYAVTLDKISGSAPATLSDQIIPPAAGDQTFAFQWDASLAAGQTLVITLTNSIRPVAGPVTVAPSSPILLTIALEGNHVAISWPTKGAVGYQLESASTSAPGAVWSPVTNAPVNLGDEYRVTLPVAGGAEFYRLKQ